jgi:hypothetical protein
MRIHRGHALRPLCRSFALPHCPSMSCFAEFPDPVPFYVVALKKYKFAGVSAFLEILKGFLMKNKGQILQMVWKRRI